MATLLRFTQLDPTCFSFLMVLTSLVLNRLRFRVDKLDTDR